MFSWWPSSKSTFTDHYQSAQNFINKHTNLDIADRIDKNTRLKMHVVTGYIYGVDHIYFDPISGSTWCDKTNMKYTATNAETEVTELKKLNEDFAQDCRALSNFTSNELNVMSDTLEPLLKKSQKILKCLKCVLKTYKKAEKDKNETSIPRLNAAVKRFEEEVESLNVLYNTVILEKHRFDSSSAEGGLDPHAIQNAVAFFEENLEKWTIDIERERLAFDARLRSMVNEGDLIRSAVTIEGVHFENGNSEEKRTKLLEFTGNDPQLAENIIKMANQALLGAAGAPLIMNILSNKYVLSSGNDCPAPGLKSIEITRNGDEIKAIMKGVYYFSHLTAPTTPLLSIDQTVTATISERDLREGKSSQLILENTFTIRS